MYSAQAAKTKYQRQVILQQQDIFETILEAEKFKFKVFTDIASDRRHLLF